MKKILLGSRTERPCYFDMAARFPWTDGRTNYGRGFRIGDRAGAYIRLLHWRMQNPDRRLVILDDPSFPESQHAASLSPEWMFADIADEIWKLYPEEKIKDAPEGENIYDESLWFLWKDLRFYRPPLLDPKISVPPELIENFKNDLPRQNIGDRFVIVQPLLDATYNQKRNQDPQWWNKLISLLSDHCDVVVLGTVESNQKLGPQAHPRTRIFNSVDPMISLALMSLASCFVGGETGLTLWAPILKVPTVGLMSREHKGYLMDTAPLSFGAPVNCFPLEDEANLIAHWVLQFMSQHRL